ncbi:hypothetical protein P691DRAFT_715003, partial [Macrolepiota fuliginosa MF-IS2]
MLSDVPVAIISDGADGCTFASSSFEVSVSSQPVTLWDTVGFGQSDAGIVSDSDAISQLYKLIRSLSDGVSLLMFVLRAPRIMSSDSYNWKIFQGVICQWRVPIVIVITGLEELEDRNRWWWDNEQRFRKDSIFPAGFACVTATRGKKQKRGEGHVFDEEYEESREAIRELIISKSLPLPWQVPPADWFKTIIITTPKYERFWFWLRSGIWRPDKQEVAGEAVERLITLCGMSYSDAKELADHLRG